MWSSRYCQRILVPACKAATHAALYTSLHARQLRQHLADKSAPACHSNQVGLNTGHQANGQRD